MWQIIFINVFFRVQVLNTEIKALKKQLPQLLQKTEHDNELIEALMVSHLQEKRNITWDKNKTRQWEIYMILINSFWICEYDCWFCISGPTKVTLKCVV